MKNLFIIFIALGLVSLASCKQSEGEKAEVKEATTKAPDKVQTTGKTMLVVPSKSVINWEGTKPTGTHTGTLDISKGAVTVNDAQITSGKFDIDMTSITVTDLEGDQKASLEAHLKGEKEGEEDHFFNVAKHPTASFEITKVVNLEGEEGVNRMVYGNLTIKGTTKQVGFKANVDVNPTEGMVKVTAPKFTINRTDWGVNYGSKSIFDNLGDKFINDEIGIEISLVASQAAM